MKTQSEETTPKHLQCHPRKFNVSLSNDHEFTCDLEFTIIIKCTDEMLHEHNDFWSNSEWRLQDNNGDIVSVILKMIGRKVYWHCHNQGSLSTESQRYGINSIFNTEGWGPECFEITHIEFNNYVELDSFEFEEIPN